jgi:hypothetical protein
MAPKRSACAWRGRSCLSRMVCVAATVLADPARSLGARNQRSREQGRLDARSDSSPHVRGQLSPTQPTNLVAGSVLRRAVPAPHRSRRRVRHPSHRACTRSRGAGRGPWGDGCMSLRCCGSDRARAEWAKAPLSPPPPFPWPPSPPLPLATLRGSWCWEPRGQRQLCQVEHALVPVPAPSSPPPPSSSGSLCACIQSWSCRRGVVGRV